MLSHILHKSSILDLRIVSCRGQSRQFVVLYCYVYLIIWGELIIVMILIVNVVARRKRNPVEASCKTAVR